MKRKMLISLAKIIGWKGLPDECWEGISFSSNGKISLPIEAEKILGVDIGTQVYYLVYKNLPGNEGLSGVVIVRKDVLHKYIYNNAESFILSVNSKNKDTPDYTSKIIVGAGRQLSMPKEAEEVQVKKDSRLDLLGYYALPNRSDLPGIVVVNSSEFESYIWNKKVPPQLRFMRGKIEEQ